ncbi:Oidioi.mRNA.OKI2018_I69.XSR.g15431.t1.cds [Oikopleura dioica]|uniref:Oidioi.mRNA.OKI2018_I69.XSR.g15431.t1.cds n=1 Tax=Oikopleura dioica TaxID=34765 RepID=A0ABN7SJ87_OIKDI|nr:Oidioi.mRNA.OKI2018_I69.XSR.g15431.t1.cds [Oikopleura dioica]
MMYMSILGPYLQSQPYDSLSPTDKKILGQIQHLSAGNSVFTNRSNRPPFIVKRKFTTGAEDECNDKCEIVVMRGICSATSLCEGVDFAEEDASCEGFSGRLCFKYERKCITPCLEKTDD